MRLAQLLLSILFLLLFARPAWADLLADIKARGRLVVGVSDVTPPFSFRRPGEPDPAGYDLDLVRRVAQRLGVALDMVSIPDTERIPILQQGKVDLVASTFTRTPERLREVDFSVTIFFSPHVIIVDKASGLTSVQQLAGRKIGVLKGRTSDKSLLDAIPTAELVYVDNYAIAFAGIKAGKLAAFATDNLVLRTYLKKESDADQYFFLPDYTNGRNAGFGMKKGEPGLKDAVDRALLDLEASGEAAQIFDVWFGPRSEVPLTRSFRIKLD